MGTDKVIFVEVKRWGGATGSDRVRMLDRRWRQRPWPYVTGSDRRLSDPEGVPSGVRMRNLKLGFPILFWGLGFPSFFRVFSDMTLPVKKNNKEKWKKKTKKKDKKTKNNKKIIINNKKKVREKRMGKYFITLYSENKSLIFQTLWFVQF